MDVTKLTPAQQRKSLLQLTKILSHRYNTTPRTLVGKLMEEEMAKECNKLIAPSSIILTNRGADISIGNYDRVEVKQSHVKYIKQQYRIDRGQLYTKPYFTSHDWHTSITERNGLALGIMDDSNKVIAGLVIVGKNNIATLNTLFCQLAGVASVDDVNLPPSTRSHLTFSLEQVLGALNGKNVFYIHNHIRVNRTQFKQLFGIH